MASPFACSLRSHIGCLIARSTSVRPTHITTSRAFQTYTRGSTQSTHQYYFPRATKPTSRTYSTVVVQDRPRGRSRRIVTTVVLGLTSFLAGGYLALSYAPPYLTSLIMGSIPTDEETLKYEAPDQWTQEIDAHIKNCKLAQDLRARSDWNESRPHLKIPQEVRQHNLTGGTLAGPDAIAIPPYYFNQKDGKAMVCIFYVGTHVSGHPGIVHGGFLATMLDEGLARCAFPAMPNKVGVTAQLNIRYRKPTMAGQFLVLAAETTKVEGRKAWSMGSIVPLEEATMDENGKLDMEHALVSADALFIEPKYAKVLKSIYRQAT